jgi:methylated-DNA-protein-cysteine methyltransferase related protein
MKARRPPTPARLRTAARPAGGERASTASVNPAWIRIYAVVRAIPRGRVATYGEVAALAGIADGHRVAARALRSCPEHLPWQRVVGRKDARRAQIAIGEPEHAALQRAMLEAESVVFDDNGFIPMRRSGWLSAPNEAVQRGPAAKRGSRAKTPPQRKRTAR